MNAATLFLAGDGALLTLAVLAVTIVRRPFAPVIIYGAALAISAALMSGAKATSMRASGSGSTRSAKAWT
jgi:hypothetical protein